MQIRVKIEEERIIPDVNVKIPTAWLRGRDVRTRREVELMFQKEIRRVIEQWCEWFVNSVRGAVIALWPPTATETETAKDTTSPG